MPKNSNYSSSSTAWFLLNLDFTEPNYGIRLYFDQIDTAHADMCFSNFTLTQSVYYMNHVNCFTELFEAMSDYRKIVLLTFLNKLDNVLINECGVLKNNSDHLYIEL